MDNSQARKLQPEKDLTEIPELSDRRMDGSLGAKRQNLALCWRCRSLRYSTQLTNPKVYPQSTQPFRLLNRLRLQNRHISRCFLRGTWLSKMYGQNWRTHPRTETSEKDTYIGPCGQQRQEAIDLCSTEMVTRCLIYSNPVKAGSRTIC